MRLDLNSPRNRLLVAAAISIALHEAAAGLIPRDLWRPAPSREVVTRAAILRVAVRPVTTPAPRPAPSTEPAHPIVAAAPAAPRRIAASATSPRAASPARRSSVRRAPPVAAANGRPVWDVGGAAGSRAVVASAGSESAGGESASGTGSGAAAATDNRPCGFVIFSDPHGSQYDTRTRGFWVDIRMRVRFADGTTQSMILDYPWYYSSEAVNPWSGQNLRDPNFPTRFQQPPPDKAAGEPPLVQYVMTHSTADGLTLLRDCPMPPPAPGAP